MTGEDGLSDFVTRGGEGISAVGVGQGRVWERWGSWGICSEKRVSSADSWLDGSGLGGVEEGREVGSEGGSRVEQGGSAVLEWDG